MAESEKVQADRLRCSDCLIRLEPFLRAKVSSLRANLTSTRSNTMTSRISPATRLLRPLASVSTPSSIFLATASVTVTVVSLLYVKKSSKTSLEQDVTPQSQQQFKMDVDLMDRIAAKPYLPVTKHRTVPRRLRLLVIDVPEMRTDGIDGECRVNHNKIFADNIAPPKHVAGTDIQVVQKSLAHALVKCRSRDSLRIGVEMTEASVADLNPHNLRKTHQFGNYRYDPGKYTSKTNVNQKSDGEEHESENVTVDETTVTVTVEQETKLPSKPATTNVKKDGPDGGTVLATDEDEYDAPWNQYAWIQELQLRVSMISFEQ